MDPVAAYTTVGLLLGLVALIKVGIPVWKWAANVGSRISGALDNLGGRPEFVDQATGKTVPAIPAIGERLGGIDQKLDDLANTNTRLDNHDERLNAHEVRLNDHDTNIAQIIAHTFERGATAALAAVEKQEEP